MKVKVICNPYANRWRAHDQVPSLRAAFAGAGVECDLALTPAPRAGMEIAFRAAQEGFDAVVAAGGDGTVSEVVNGLIRAAGPGPTVPLGVVPIGTGNDFGDMAGLPRAADAAARVIAAGKTRQVDAGRVNDHYFDNNCALAMEPMVTLEHMAMTHLSGNVRYVVAMLKCLLKLRAWQMEVAWDGGIFAGPTYLLSVCNSPRTGGVFHMAPPAELDDGLFDFVFAPEMPKWKVLTIVPRLFSGSHLQHALIRHGRTRRLTIHSEPGTPIHADGELIARAATHVEYEVLPGKITLLVP